MLRSTHSVCVQAYECGGYRSVLIGRLRGRRRRHAAAATKEGPFGQWAIGGSLPWSSRLREITEQHGERSLSLRRPVHFESCGSVNLSLGQVALREIAGGPLSIGSRCCASGRVLMSVHFNPFALGTSKLASNPQVPLSNRVDALTNTVGHCS